LKFNKQSQIHIVKNAANIFCEDDDNEDDGNDGDGDGDIGEFVCYNES